MGVHYLKVSQSSSLQTIHHHDKRLGRSAGPAGDTQKSASLEEELHPFSAPKMGPKIKDDKVGFAGL